MYKFSVVIPTYNDAMNLHFALMSVFSQTYKNFEVIVVDNQSSDDTRSVVEGFRKRFSTLKFFQIRNDGIIAKSRNLGIKHARGEYVAFLDSDDLWYPHKLEMVELKTRTGIDIVYHDMDAVRENKNSFFRKKLKSRNLGEGAYIDLLSNGNAIANSSAVVKKSALYDVGLADESINLVAYEDYDLWLILARRNFKFTRINQSLGRYLIRNKSSSSTERHINGTMFILEKHLQLHFLKNETRVPIWALYVLSKSYHIVGFQDESDRLRKKLPLNVNGIKLRSKLILYQVLQRILKHSEL